MTHLIQFWHFWLYLSKVSALILIVLAGWALAVLCYTEFRNRKNGWFLRSLWFIGIPASVFVAFVLFVIALAVPPQF